MLDADLETDQRIDAPKYKRVSRAAEALILKLAEAGKSQTEIAQIVGVSQPTVSRTLAEFADTRVVAKAVLNKHAKTLAERVVKDADVSQSLEVLDRLDVAPKRRDETHSTQVMVVVQTQSVIPGIQTLSPVSHKEIQDISTA